MDYFDRDGNQITMERWAALSEDKGDYSRVAVTEVHGYRVSTVWLGLNHAFDGGPPLVFETMVFGDETEGDLLGRRHVYHISIDQLTERYTTEDEARRGHELIVEQIRQMVAQVQGDQ